MRKRSLAREIAIQVLYQIDITGDSPGSSLENFWVNNDDDSLDTAVKEFATDLVEGVVKNLESIDSNISQYAANWQLNRMAFVDRNVLRLGTYELIYRNDIPPKVSINEAVELAKKYSGPEAGKFVNGILDKIKQEKKR